MSIKHDLFDKIKSPVFIETDRLTITDIENSDKDLYAKIYLDDDLNKWWGYDYREDLKGEEPTPDYFYSFQKRLKEIKEEYLFIVRLNGIMIGELVLYNFGDDRAVEVGFRFFPEYQGKGYAKESANSLIEYAKTTLGAKKIKSRCFKENLPSRRLILSLGLSQTSEDTTHYYFEKIFD